MTTTTARAVFWRLHDDTQTAVGLRLTDSFVDHLDQVRRSTPAEQAHMAHRRLEHEYPALYAVVALTEGQGLSLCEAGRRLGVTHRTVSKRRTVALQKMRSWCDNAPNVVPYRQNI